jgi:hypothetical protein
MGHRTTCNFCNFRWLKLLAEQDGARIETEAKTLGEGTAEPMHGLAIYKIKDGLKLEIGWMWTIGERCEC